MICNALGLLSFESIVDKIGFGVSMFLLIPNMRLRRDVCMILAVVVGRS